MVTVPAFAWRGGALRRAVTLGIAIGIFLAAMAWIDSGMLLGAIIAFVVTGVLYGIVMHRRMKRYWPGAKELSGDDRVAVVRAVRRGERVGDARLTQAVTDYSHGLHAAAEEARPFRWLVPLVLVVAVATAVYDAVFGSWGNVVASIIYLVLLMFELFWWPKRREQLLANADRAVEMTRHTETSD
jgi:O-antigen/teichoic acid export membrane protein